MDYNEFDDAAISRALLSLDIYRFWDELVHNYTMLIKSLESGKDIGAPGWTEFENANSNDEKISVVNTELVKSQSELDKATIELKNSDAEIFPVGFKFSSASGIQFRIVDEQSIGVKHVLGFRSVCYTYGDGTYYSINHMPIDSIAGHIADCQRAVA